MYSVPVAVAPLPSGWVTRGAGSFASRLFLHTFDGAGNHVARTVVHDDDTGDFLPPLLASRPNGGPLLVWSDASGIRAAVLSNDGLTTTTPIDLYRAGGPPFAVCRASPSPVTPSTSCSLSRTLGRRRWLAALGSRLDVGCAARVRRAAENPESAINPYLVTGGNDLRIVFETWTTNSRTPR